MRWDNLRIDVDEAHRLPGYREPAVVRTFDAPEAMDIRFYEVRAKSALNRVPDASAMPFRWTINPYRGCSHACLYCCSGDTAILMTDGRTKPLAELGVGDGIYGTVRDGSYRRYVHTTVLAHWSTRKRAYRVVLEDGTELLASGDHRFLSNRGWKHVVDAPGQRPHLTTCNELLGLGKLGEQPAETEGYRRGYLCGMVRGDGLLRSAPYQRPGGATWISHQFRLALADYEGVLRTRQYLRAAGVETSEFQFAAAASGRRAMHAIRTQSRPAVDRVRDLVRWPWAPTREWRRGFLAGIFDAEGSFHGSLRIHNTDAGILGTVADSLREFGFASVEDVPNANGCRSIRLRGGLREVMRFFQLVDPAITRKRSIEGTAIKSDAKLRIAAIEDTGLEIPMFDITTGTGDFIANGVVSHNCFARPTHTYLDMNAGRDFEREIVVKVNVPEVLAVELRKPSWQHEHVALGTNTDPYQWVESKYKLLPGIWRALGESGTPCSVLTKSPLLLRDKDLFVELAKTVGFTANLSIPTLEEKAWRATEPHTPHPKARIEAVKELNRLGVPTGVLVAPLMPGINDDPKQVERIVELCEEAGATYIGGIALHLRGEVRGIFMDWLRAKRPDLVPRYEELYKRGAYAPKEEKERLNRLVRRRDTWPVGVRRGRLAPKGAAAPRNAAGRPAEEPNPPGNTQEALF